MIHHKNYMKNCISFVLIMLYGIILINNKLIIKKIIKIFYCVIEVIFSYIQKKKILKILPVGLKGLINY